MAEYAGGPFVGSVSREDWERLAPRFQAKWRQYLATHGIDWDAEQASEE